MRYDRQMIAPASPLRHVSTLRRISGRGWEKHCLRVRSVNFRPPAVTRVSARALSRKPRLRVRSVNFGLAVATRTCARALSGKACLCVRSVNFGLSAATRAFAQALSGKPCLRVRSVNFTFPVHIMIADSTGSKEAQKRVRSVNPSTSLGTCFGLGISLRTSRQASAPKPRLCVRSVNHPALIPRPSIRPVQSRRSR